MTNSAWPLLTAFRSWVETSKVPSLMVPNLPSDCSAPPAAENPRMPVVSTPSMVGSALSAFSIALAAEFSWAPLTCSTVTEPPLACIAWVNPLQRSVSAVFCASWMTHSALCTPAPAISRAASAPAAVSSWPTNVRPPTPWYTSTPTFITITGMPAETACLIGADSTAASGIVTTSPFGCCPAALVMSEACSCGFVVLGEL